MCHSLVAEFLKEIAPFCFERCCIRKNGHRKWKRRNRRAILRARGQTKRAPDHPEHLHRNTTGKAVTINTSAENLARTFGTRRISSGQLKTGKGACDSNEPIQRGGLKTPFSSNLAMRERADLVRTVQIQNPFWSSRIARK